MINKISTRNELLEILNKDKIEFKLVEHVHVEKIDDMKKNIKLEKSDFYKNLFYGDKKGNYYLIVAHHETKVEKIFWKKLGTTYNNVRMRPDQLLEVLNVKKGCANPFSLLNDLEKKVKLILDENMEKYDYYSFHPLENISTLEISKKDFFNFLNYNKIEYQHVNLTEKKEEIKVDTSKKNNKEENLLKIEVKKTDNFSKWYTEVIKKSEMIEYYDVSGCYILRPNSFFIWEKVQDFLDKEFKTLNVKNVYFPMFVTANKLEKEKNHLEGFSAEVAWVTHSGKSKLNEPIAIRPTSETIMYPAFSKWIRSHRDLPLLINQWTNIVRWEFKNPTPFIRTREFLWQEGHTAHATKEDASEFAYKILDKYEKAYKEVLCIPVIKGVKSENEKFAGADFTTTCETFIPENGRAIQACTSHMLGQNFSKMFDIKYEDKNQNKKEVWQTSWGFTTRSIGVLVMMHGDNKGLVLPPKVANFQVIIIPIYIKNKMKEKIKEVTENLNSELNKRGIRTTLDDRTNYTSGYKFNDSEMKGIPLRIEVGPNDVEKKKLKLVQRFDNEKFIIDFNQNYDDLVNIINETFTKIENLMFEKSKNKIFNMIKEAENWNQFMEYLNENNILKTKWCDNSNCEDKIKKESGEQSKLEENEDGMSGSAKSLCKPLNQDKLEENDKCFKCGEKAKTYILWGRSY